MSWPRAGSMTWVSACLTAASVIIVFLYGVAVTSGPGRVEGPAATWRLGQMPQLGLLCRKIPRAVLGRGHPVRLMRGDHHPGALQTADLLRIVGHQADRGDPEVGQDAGGEIVRSEVGVEPELEVGVDGVGANLQDLVDSMYAENGLGIAALQ